MKFNKTSIYILLLIMGMNLSSCKEESLNEISPDKVTMANFWTNETNAKAAIMEAYQKLTMNNWRFGEYEMNPMYYRGDDVKLQSGATDWSYLENIGKFTYRNTNDVIANYWWQKYRSLNVANWVIANIGTIPAGNINADQQKYIKGEALFIRAVLHMQLLQNYKQIVLKKAATNKDNLNEGLSSREDSWKLITEDFKQAAELLPISWSSENLGRATKNAAYGFLGKAYLYQKKYTDAHKALKKIAGADLVSGDDYENLFNGKKENSIESIFEVQFSAISAGGLSKNHSGASTMATNDFGGWNMFNPSQKLMNSFMKEKTPDNKYDKRLIASVAFNDPAATFLGEPAQSYFGDNIVPKPCYKKYIEDKKSISSGESGANFFYMRYADVLLMDAEAITEGATGTSLSTAVDLINRIRNRAGLANFAGSDKATITKELRKQRFLEFNGEGMRFYDLVRWGIAKEEILNSDKKGKANFRSPEHNYFPIPNGEITNNPSITE
ncbi:MAG: RagB/SusD family nutrient uptake outer membrane protein [Marinifilaceae bacterium]